MIFFEIFFGIFFGLIAFIVSMHMLAEYGKMQDPKEITQLAFFESGGINDLEIRRRALEALCRTTDIEQIKKIRAGISRVLNNQKGKVV